MLYNGREGSGPGRRSAVKRGHTAHRIVLLVPCAALASLAGCSWVSLTPSGERVRVLSKEEVSVCERVGTTTAMTKNAVLGIGRSYLDIAEELQYLARNTAAGMGGDTIADESGIQGGQQTFGVYRCVGSVGRSTTGGSDSRYAPAVSRPLPP